MAMIEANGHREIARWRDDRGGCFVLTWRVFKAPRLLYSAPRRRGFVTAAKFAPGLDRVDAFEAAWRWVRGADSPQHPMRCVRTPATDIGQIESEAVSGGWR